MGWKNIPYWMRWGIYGFIDFGFVAFLIILFAKEIEYIIAFLIAIVGFVIGIIYGSIINKIKSKK